MSLHLLNRLSADEVLAAVERDCCELYPSLPFPQTRLTCPLRSCWSCRAEGDPGRANSWLEGALRSEAPNSLCVSPTGTGEEHALRVKILRTLTASLFLGGKTPAFDQECSVLTLTFHCSSGLWKCQPKSECHSYARLFPSVKR